MRVIAILIAGLLLARPAVASESHVVNGSAAIASPSRTVALPHGAQQIVFEYQWPGVYFESPFNSRFVTVKVKDSANRLAFYVDGNPVETVSRPGDTAIKLGPFSPGNHMLRMEKLSESQGDTATLIGIFPQTKKAGVLPLPERTRQIEFIGDSYTVGYGNTSGKRQCTGEEIWATTDTSQAFGPLTAKHYDADYQINAYSGRGVVRNWDGGPGDPLPVLYPYALFDGKTTYEPAGWAPQIIVIGLGTNDFSTQLHTGEKWPTRDALHADYEATYVNFVQNLRAQNPQAFFILMASDQVDGEIQSEVQKVIASLQAKGESRIAFVGLGALDYMGCNWHPSAADDMLISQNLITFIDAHPDLWQGK